MAISDHPARRVRGSSNSFGTVLAIVVLTLMELSLSACAGSSQYYGIELVSTSTGTSAEQRELQELARRAKSGDKQAQLELGIRYEEGVRLPQDLKRAEKLYRLASEASGDEITYYQPSSELGKPGIVVTEKIDGGLPGLPAAKARLIALRAKRSAQ